jgi:hypothetical protein
LSGATRTFIAPGRSRVTRRCADSKVPANSWLRENTGFANVSVEHLEIDNGRLFAFTHGRSVWSVPLAQETDVPDACCHHNARSGNWSNATIQADRKSSKRICTRLMRSRFSGSAQNICLFFNVRDA